MFSPTQCMSLHKHPIIVATTYTSRDDSNKSSSLHEYMTLLSNGYDICHGTTSDLHDSHKQLNERMLYFRVSSMLQCCGGFVSARMGGLEWRQNLEAWFAHQE